MCPREMNEGKYYTSLPFPCIFVQPGLHLRCRGNLRNVKKIGAAQQHGTRKRLMGYKSTVIMETSSFLFSPLLLPLCNVPLCILFLYWFLSLSLFPPYHLLSFYLSVFHPFHHNVQSFALISLYFNDQRNMNIFLSHIILKQFLIIFLQNVVWEFIIYP